MVNNLIQNSHTYSHTVESVQFIEQIDSTSASEIADECASFLHDSIRLVPENSSYTVELKLKNDLSGTFIFELIFVEKGNKGEAMQSPSLLREETCDKCRTVFEHTYRCLDQQETELEKKSGNRPSKFFGNIVENDDMIAVISSKNCLLITPDPEKINDYLEYTHLFELPLDRIRKITLPIFHIASCLNVEGTKPSEYTIKWNAGTPANTVKVFHTRFERLPERFL